MYHVKSRTKTDQVFFGTPHRSSLNCRWEYTLSNLLYSQYTDLTSAWIPRAVQSLSKFHEQLSTTFNSISDQRSLDTVSYYQKESESGTYEIVSRPSRQDIELLFVAELSVDRTTIRCYYGQAE